jgi:O-antigen/teichoic acid export membrane protein
MDSEPTPAPSVATAPAATGGERITTKILRETTRFALIESFGAILAFAAQIALARLLDLRDFGVFGICSFYIGIGQLLGNGGLGATLLRRSGEVKPEEYRATVTALLGIAALLAGALWIATPWIAEKNQLAPNEALVLRAMAPLYFVGALRVVPYVRLERQLLFSAIARIELTANVLKYAVAIVIAAFHGGVWALVASQLTAALIQIGGAYFVAPGWVGFGWSWRVFRPLISYGSKVQGLAILAYLKDNLSRGLLGTLIGPSAVGAYDFGVGFIGVPVQAVNGLARVQLPVYARFEAHDVTLHGALRGSMRTAMLAGIPLLGVLALASSWAIPLIYGAQWAPAYPVIRGLFMNMVCGLVLSPLFTLLQGQGRAGLALIVFGTWTAGTWALAGLGLALWPGSVGAVATAQSVATVVVTAYLLLWVSRHVRRNMLADIAAPMIAGAIGLGAGALLAWRGGPIAGHPLTTAVVFLIVYFAVLFALDGKLVIAEAKAIVRAALGRASKPKPGA